MNAQTMFFVLIVSILPSFIISLELYGIVVNYCLTSIVCISLNIDLYFSVIYFGEVELNQ